MIDLKELERRLDEALEKETDASLTEWLSAQRKGDIFCYDDLCVENTITYESYDVYNIDQVHIETSFNNSTEIKSLDLVVNSFDFGYCYKDMEYNDIVVMNLAAA